MCAVEEDCDGDFGDMSIRGNAGWKGMRAVVGDVDFETATWFSTSLFEMTEKPEDAVVGREPFSLSANFAAFLLCHRRLFGNGLLGSEVHLVCH